jgi:hypothetical protein
MIVYSRVTGVRRRVIDADDDAEYLAHEATLHPGEGFFYLTHAEYDAHDNPHVLNHTTATRAGFSATLELHDGVPHDVTVHYPEGDQSIRSVDRHAIIAPGGRVIGACHADLTCGDSGEHFAVGHLLVRHAIAGEGWTYDGSTFTQSDPQPYVPPKERPWVRP